jgi:hypothetical protein
MRPRCPDNTRRRLARYREQASRRPCRTGTPQQASDILEAGPEGAERSRDMTHSHEKGTAHDA